MRDVTGLLVNELRGDPGVSGIVSDRIAAGAMDPRWPADPRPCVVIVRLSTVRRRPGRQVPLYVARCYGAGDDSDPRVAMRTSAELNGVVGDALHLKGPRKDGLGRSISISLEEVGGQPGTDPGTGWAYESSVFQMGAVA